MTTEELKQLSCLIVDDDSFMLSTLSLLLKQFGVKQVFQADNAQDGLKLIANRNIHIDIVISDLNMPEMDGFQATRTLSGSADTKMIPVVLVTAKDQKADRVWGQMLGVKGYITKPYPPQALLDIVKAIG